MVSFMSALRGPKPFYSGSAFAVLPYFCCNFKPLKYKYFVLQKNLIRNNKAVICKMGSKIILPKITIFGSKAMEAFYGVWTGIVITGAPASQHWFQLYKFYILYKFINKF